MSYYEIDVLLYPQETIISKVDAGKKDLSKIVGRMAIRKPSFEDAFNANRELARPLRDIHSSEVVVKEPETEPPNAVKIASSAVHHELICPHADLIQFWKPATAKDLAYVSPYAIEGADTRYVTFEPGNSVDYHEKEKNVVNC